MACDLCLLSAPLARRPPQTPFKNDRRPWPACVTAVCRRVAPAAAARRASQSRARHGRSTGTPDARLALRHSHGHGGHAGVEGGRLGLPMGPATAASRSRVRQRGRDGAPVRRAVGLDWPRPACGAPSCARGRPGPLSRKNSGKGTSCVPPSPAPPPPTQLPLQPERKAGLARTQGRPSSRAVTRRGSSAAHRRRRTKFTVQLWVVAP